MLRAQVTASALESTIAFLGQIKEGRKAILFVSQTIGRVGQTMSDTVHVARRHDPARERQQHDDLFARSARPRHERADVRHPAVARREHRRQAVRQQLSRRVAAQIVKEASAFYLLGYRSEKNPADGKFHKIAVKVKRQGVDVKARTGYFAPSAVEMDTARQEGGRGRGAAGDLESALDARGRAAHGGGGRLWAGATRGADGRRA